MKFNMKPKNSVIGGCYFNIRKVMYVQLRAGDSNIQVILRREKRMRGIKEEDARDENHLSKLEVSPITRANKSKKEEMNSDDTLRQIRQTIKRKANRSKKKTRQTQKKSKTLHPL